MLIQDIYNFFFEYKIHSSFAAILRISYCSFFVGWFAYTIKDIWEFSKPDGIFNGKKYIEISTTRQPQISLFNIYPNSKFFHELIFILFFIFGIFSIIGFMTNISLLIFTIAFISIQSRVWVILVTGGDPISRMMLFSLIFIDCGSKYSVDSFLGYSSNLDFIDGWTIRLLQINICILYFFSAISKLKDQTWLNGDTVKYAIYSGTWGRRLFLNLRLKEWIWKSLTWSVLLFEYFAPILFSISELRIFAIIFGICFHLGTTIFMTIGSFGPIMILALLSFCNQYFIK